ncbi:unnamed protein product, partial [Mesorhabditis belari]|uniref:C-type lectin domain-containing protein n=1 Tax=Mesorhabditis belari TaxID=2138241 RepID=A0AAF3FCL5_9BILA
MWSLERKLDKVIGNNSHSYIGVQQQNGNWVYGDGSPLIYQNWKSGHPLSNMSCAVISAKDYQWTSVDCASSHSFICSIPDQTPTQTTTIRVITTRTTPSTITPPTVTPPSSGE